MSEIIVSYERGGVFEIVTAGHERSPTAILFKIVAPQSPNLDREWLVMLVAELNYMTHERSAAAKGIIEVIDDIMRSDNHAMRELESIGVDVSDIGMDKEMLEKIERLKTEYDRGEEFMTLTRRTNDPKLQWLETQLANAGIESKRDGESFHAPILRVKRTDHAAAWVIAGLVDDITDDDPRFQDVSES